MNFGEFMSQYWWAVVIAVAVIAFIVIALVSNNKKMKQCIKYFIAMAEKELGTGTGQLKLQMVYDKFVEKFPVFSNFVSYSRFSKLVDDALVEFNKLLDSNKSINDYVNGVE